MARTTFAQNGLVRLGYEAQGDTGPVVMLLHGLLADRASLRPLMDALEDRAIVIAMDLRGHGGSSAFHGVDVHLSDLVNDAFAVLDVAAGFTQPVTVVGVELGAVIADLMRASDPERVIGTVLVNYPTAEMRDAAMLDEIATRAYREQTAQALNRWLDLSWGESWEAAVPKPRIAAARRSVQAIHPVLTAMAAGNLPERESLRLPGGTPFAAEDDVAAVLQLLGPYLIGG